MKHIFIPARTVVYAAEEFWWCHEGLCERIDIDGGGHERGQNCPECSDMPVPAASVAEK